MLNGFPIGTVCAFAGQLDPVTGDANNIWKSSCCPSVDSKAGILNPDIPLTHVETIGWMLCDGRFLRKDIYPELFAVIGYLYGNKNDDLFRLPDYRGLFLRGVDAGSGMDPDASNRIAPLGDGKNSGIGSLQCDAMQEHAHTYKSVVLAAPSQQGNAAGQKSSDELTSIPQNPARVTSETRCKNISVNYIIRFR